MSDGPANLTNSTNAFFRFNSSEDNSTFQCSLDGAAFAACTSPQSYSGLADGSHSFQVRAIDPAGNIDPAPAGRNWIVDTTPPETTISEGPADPTNSTPFALDRALVTDRKFWPQATVEKLRPILGRFVAIDRVGGAVRFGTSSPG